MEINVDNNWFKEENKILGTEEEPNSRRQRVKFANKVKAPARILRNNKKYNKFLLTPFITPISLLERIQ